MSKYKNTEKFIKSYGESVVKEIRTRLRSNGKVASGSLEKSIGFKIFEQNGKIGISYKMNYYGDFVDKGVQGAKSGKAGEGGKSKYKFKNKMPPEKEIKKWMKIKGIQEKALYPIRKKIFEKGITPTNFFTIPITRRKKQFFEGIRINMIKDIEQNIK